ncbi:uncharacterized protein LOC134653726 [Cydia amplana]|uniref:uncharacterized protein LOC134653726 n=1 Tax=Cydia amplana TaxID=1869771 RepID=UPI002FE57784
MLPMEEENAAPGEGEEGSAALHARLVALVRTAGGEPEGRVGVWMEHSYARAKSGAAVRELLARPAPAPAPADLPLDVGAPGDCDPAPDTQEPDAVDPEWEARVLALAPSAMHARAARAALEALGAFRLARLASAGHADASIKRDQARTASRAVRRALAPLWAAPNGMLCTISFRLASAGHADASIKRDQARTASRAVRRALAPLWAAPNGMLCTISFRLTSAGHADASIKRDQARTASRAVRRALAPLWAAPNGMLCTISFRLASAGHADASIKRDQARTASRAVRRALAPLWAAPNGMLCTISFRLASAGHADASIKRDQARTASRAVRRALAPLWAAPNGMLCTISFRLASAGHADASIKRDQARTASRAVRRALAPLWAAPNGMLCTISFRLTSAGHADASIKRDQARTASRAVRRALAPLWAAPNGMLCTISFRLASAGHADASIKRDQARTASRAVRRALAPLWAARNGGSGVAPWLHGAILAHGSHWAAALWRELTGEWRRSLPRLAARLLPAPAAPPRDPLARVGPPVDKDVPGPWLVWICARGEDRWARRLRALLHVRVICGDAPGPGPGAGPGPSTGPEAWCSALMGAARAALLDVLAEAGSHPVVAGGWGAGAALCGALLAGGAGDAALARVRALALLAPPSHPVVAGGWGAGAALCGALLAGGAGDAALARVRALALLAPPLLTVTVPLWQVAPGGGGRLGRGGGAVRRAAGGGSHPVVAGGWGAGAALCGALLAGGAGDAALARVRALALLAPPLLTAEGEATHLNRTELDLPLLVVAGSAGATCPRSLACELAAGGGAARRVLAVRGADDALRLPARLRRRLVPQHALDAAVAEEVARWALTAAEGDALRRPARKSAGAGEVVEERHTSMQNARGLIREIEPAAVSVESARPVPRGPRRSLAAVPPPPPTPTPTPTTPTPTPTPINAEPAVDELDIMQLPIVFADDEPAPAPPLQRHGETPHHSMMT